MAADPAQFQPAPYCGPAPAPAELLSRWNLDPWLLACFALGALFLVRRRSRPGTLQAATAWALLALAFVSPLCAWASALFSARTVHHALLIVAAAPLLVAGHSGGRRLGLAPATLLHAAVLWIWHAPGAYAWALSNDAAYWLMQTSLLGSAIIFWRETREASAIGAAAGLLATFLHTGLLGALITFAAEPLYAPHLATTQAWGVAPLADQQLAGLIMWAPMSGAYLAAALFRFGRSLNEDVPRAARA